MKRKGLLLVSLLLASAEVSASELDLAALDRMIEETFQKGGMVGLSVGVLHEGEIVLAKGYGVRSVGTREPVTPETLFAIGSVTKQFTCAATLLLGEAGRLRLDDPVSRYFPDLTRAADITLLDLGQHVGGYRDYYPLDFVTRPMQQPRHADEIIREYAGGPLDFEPGTRWSYSNTGFLVLGRVVELTGGSDFGSFLETSIFEPAGMRQTLYEPTGDEPDLATGHGAYALADLRTTRPEGRGWIGAAGGVWSTPADLLRWDLALMNGKLLSPTSYATLTAPGRLADGRSTNYGCGLVVVEHDEALVLAHSGAVEGFLARSSFVPETRSGVALLTNTDRAGAALRALNDRILDLLVPPASAVPEVAGPPALDAAAAFLGQLRAGAIDRAALGEEFDAYLTDERVRAAAASLRRFRKPKDLEVTNSYERGGMEVSVIRFKMGPKAAQALMYRTPDGKIQELLVLDAEP